MSTAAYLYSGQVWMERWDSAMTTTPEIPNGLNSWKTTSTMVAWARFAASTRAPFTFSRLLMASESQSNNSSSRCRPRAFNPLILLCPCPSTAPLLRRATRRRSLHYRAEKILRREQLLLDCRVRFRPLQEKTLFEAVFRPPKPASEPVSDCSATTTRARTRGAAAAGDARRRRSDIE